MIGDRLQKLVEEMVDKGVRFEDALGEFERRFLLRVLGQCDGSVTKASSALGLHRNTLSRKLAQHKITRSLR
jgi:Fis family transcriptional regulator, factor for inversion stimulation protein